MILTHSSLLLPGSQQSWKREILYRGAVRLACPEDTVPEVSDTTIAGLRSKQPAAHPDISLLPAPKEEAHEAASIGSEREVAQAIRSFPRGSARGPGGLKPQHDQHVCWGWGRAIV